MYEAEVNHSVAPITELPVEIARRFGEMREAVEARSILPWGEHCTECNFPTCYTTCELYSPRADKACRLFVGGMIRLDHPEGLNPYLLRITFKQWGKLWTVGNLKLHSPAEAAKKERSNITIGAVARSLPAPAEVKARILRKVAYRRRRLAEDAAKASDPADAFLFECYNPNQRRIDLTFTVRPRDRNVSAFFQRMIRVPPGFIREMIPAAHIVARVDVKQPFEIEIVPNDCDNTTLYFGCLDFIRQKVSTVSRDTGRAWKCIIWDLDNTLWDGILVEDGPDKIKVRAALIEVIRETDRRGILHSIASKNNLEDALKVLRMHGLEEYFLYPQINWQPKSASISRIAQLLNIGLDTIAFVDDQPFEREEVQTALAQVTVVDSKDSEDLHKRPQCSAPVTEESRQRRQMYRQQQEREVVMSAFQGDYTGFLRDCGIRLSIDHLDHGNIERVYELAQRTNQMNFSGNKYLRSELHELMLSEASETFVIRCTDKFGSYGIVGFAVVDPQEPRLLDLMFSCRIQGKRVEHAFLSFLLNRFFCSGPLDFFANYRQTAKNSPSGKVFEEMGFEKIEEKDGVSSLVFRKERVVPDDGIIIVEGKSEMASVGNLARGMSINPEQCKVCSFPASRDISRPIPPNGPIESAPRSK